MSYMYSHRHGQPVDLKSGLSSCETRVLTTAPLRSPMVNTQKKQYTVKSPELPYCEAMLL